VYCQILCALKKTRYMYVTQKINKRETKASTKNMTEKNGEKRIQYLYSRFVEEESLHEKKLFFSFRSVLQLRITR
jgi:hypothetical protein